MIVHQEKWNVGEAIEKYQKLKNSTYLVGIMSNKYMKFYSFVICDQSQNGK